MGEHISDIYPALIGSTEHEVDGIGRTTSKGSDPFELREYDAHICARIRELIKHVVRRDDPEQLEAWAQRIKQSVRNMTNWMDEVSSPRPRMRRKIIVALHADPYKLALLPDEEWRVYLNTLPKWKPPPKAAPVMVPGTLFTVQIIESLKAAQPGSTVYIASRDVSPFLVDPDWVKLFQVNTLRGVRHVFITLPYPRVRDAIRGLGANVMAVGPADIDKLWTRTFIGVTTPTGSSDPPNIDFQAGYEHLFTPGAKVTLQNVVPTTTRPIYAGMETDRIDILARPLLKVWLKTAKWT